MASSQNLTKKMGSQFGLKLGGKFGESFGQSAKSAATTAMSTAKFGLDQVLLGLQHRGLNLEESRDLVQQVGRRVLERAEEIRKQLALSPLSPAWLKDVSLGGPAAIGAPLKADEMSESDAPFSTTSPDADASQNLAESGSIVAAEAGSIVDATVSDPVVEMQPESMKSFLAEEKSKKTRAKSAKALHNLKPAKSAKRGKKAKKAKTVTVKAKTAASAKAAPKAKAKGSAKSKSKTSAAAAHR